MVVNGTHAIADISVKVMSLCPIGVKYMVHGGCLQNIVPEGTLHFKVYIATHFDFVFVLHSW